MAWSAKEAGQYLLRSREPADPNTRRTLLIQRITKDAEQLAHFDFGHYIKLAQSSKLVRTDPRYAKKLLKKIRTLARELKISQPEKKYPKQFHRLIKARALWGAKDKLKQLRDLKEGESTPGYIRKLYFELRKHVEAGNLTLGQIGTTHDEMVQLREKADWRNFEPKS